jgi:hypothetical protein
MTKYQALCKERCPGCGQGFTRVLNGVHSGWWHELPEYPQWNYCTAPSLAKAFEDLAAQNAGLQTENDHFGAQIETFIAQVEALTKERDQAQAVNDELYKAAEALIASIDTWADGEHGHVMSKELERLRFLLETTPRSGQRTANQFLETTCTRRSSAMKSGREVRHEPFNSR